MFEESSIIFPLSIFIQMEGKGLFNKTITSLAQMIYTETTFKNNTHLINKALALGIPLAENYNRERILFVITQAIITLIDEIVTSQRIQKKPQLENEPNLKFDLPPNIPNEEKSTLNNGPKCLLGNLNIAVLIYQMFCPRTNIWDIIEKVSAIKKELERQDGIFEVVKLPDRIFKLEDFSNHRNIYKCFCQVFQLQTENPEVLNCHHCLEQFHPGCQTTPFLCNACFLRFCVMDLKDQLNDPFNWNKEIKIQFFSYLRNCFPQQQNDQITESIYFHVVKFGLKGFTQQADRKQKYIQLRVSVADKIFPDELVLPLRSQYKLKKQNNFFWELDDVEYYFYLNHNQIKFTNSISKYCIIFKIPHRILESQNNILIIKTVRRNQHYQFKDNSVLTYWPERQNNIKTLIIGIFQINKKKINHKSKNEKITKEISQDTMRQITVYQSHHYLQFIQNKINQVPFQIVNLYNSSGTKKIQIPVRSFGCHHVECFDYAQFKQNQKIKKDKNKPPKIKKKSKKNVNPLRGKQICIQIESNSSEVIQILESDQQQKEPLNQSLAIQPTLTPTLKKKIFKTNSVDIIKKKKHHHHQNKQQQDLLCPVCQRKLLILYQDPLFKQMIINSGFYKKVKILNNGQYTFQDILKQGHRPDQIQILH